MSFWKACDYPERRPDPYVLWCEDECSACALKMSVVLNGLDPTAAEDQTNIRVAHMVLDRVAPERVG